MEEIQMINMAAVYETYTLFLNVIRNIDSFVLVFRSRDKQW